MHVSGLILLYFASLCASSVDDKLRCNPPEPLVQSGDYVVAAILSVHNDPYLGCVGNRSLTQLYRVEAFIYAIHRASDVMYSRYNKTIGYKIYDDCLCEDVAAKITIDLTKHYAQAAEQCIWNCEAQYQREIDAAPHHHHDYLTGVVGGSQTKATTAIADVLAMSDIPFITPDARSAALSNKQNYPNLLRTVMSTYSSMVAIQEILQRYDWNWIVVISLESIYSDDTEREIIRSLGESNICISSILSIPIDFNEEDVLNVTSKNALDGRPEYRPPDVVVLLFPELVVDRFFSFAQGNRDVVNSKQWIVFDLLGYADGYRDMEDLPDGTIGISTGVPHPQNAEEFRQFIEEQPHDYFSHNPWLLEYKNCSNATSDWRHIHEMNTSLLSYDGVIAEYATLLDATFAICASMIAAFEDYGRVEHRRMLQFLFSKDVILTQPKEQANKSSWFSIDGFDQNGNVRGRDLHVRIIAKQNHDCLMEAGQLYKLEENKFNLSIDETKMKWSAAFNYSVPLSRCSTACQPGSYRVNLSCACCWSCFKCLDGTISPGIDAQECTPCQDGKVHNADRTECIVVVEPINWDAPEQAAVFAVAALGFLATCATTLIFAWHRNSPVVRASNRPLSFLLLFSIHGLFILPFLVSLRPRLSTCIVMGVIYYLVTSVSCAVLLVKTWHVWRIFNLKQVSVNPKHQNYMQLILLAAIVLLGLGILIPVYATKPPYPPNGEISCGEVWHAMHWISMGYGGVILVIAALVAFRARYLPENYNETKHVYVSCFVLISIEIFRIPAFYHSTAQTEVLILNLCSLAQGISLLTMMFLPKLNIIYFRPERNTKEYVKKMNLEHVWNRNSWNQLKRRAQERKKAVCLQLSEPSTSAAVTQERTFTL